MLGILVRYRKQALVASSILVLVIQATIFVAFDYDDLKEDIQTGRNYFNIIMHDRFEKLEQSSEMITNDHALKAAVTTFNEKTVYLTLINHKKRLNADLMAVMDTSNTFFASTIKEEANDTLRTKIEPIVKAMRAQSQSNITAIINLDGTIYQITIVPLKAPRTIAYIVNGFIINDTIVDNIKGITSLEITFLTLEGKSTDNIHIAATTMDDKDLEPVIETVQGKRGRLQGFLDNIVSDVVVIEQSNPSLEFLAMIKRPWTEIVNKYLISVFYVIFVIIISVMRFVLRKVA